MGLRSRLLNQEFPVASLADQFNFQSEAIFTTNTKAQLWDMNIPGRQDDILDNTALRAKLAHYESFWESDPKGTKIATPMPNLVLVTVLGEVIHGRSAPATFQIRRDTLQYLIEVTGFGSATTQKFLTTLAPYVHSYLQYDDDNEIPTYMTLVFRCPRNSNCVVGTIWVQLATRNCFAFLICNDVRDIQSIRSYCATNTDLLKIHPLYLLSCVYESRYHAWMNRFAKLWREVVEVETVTNTSGPQWKMREMDAERFKALSKAEFLLNQIHSTHVEVCHGQTVMLFAAKFGKFCSDVLIEMEKRRQDLGYSKLSMRHRSGLLESFDSTLVRCDFVADRMAELSNRLTQNINVSYQLIAQKDSKTNLAIAALTARDSQTVKGIAILTLLFLPSTLVATLWTTNLFKLEGDENWQVYVGTSLLLTMAVFICWWTYGRVSRGREDGAADHLSLYSPG